MNIDREELLARLRKMDEYAFEQLVADIWDQRGWNTSRTGKSKDGGVDVIAKKSTPFSQKQIIQAKRYAAGSTVGSGDIQQYSSLKEEQASTDVVVIVTTGTFSNKAQEKASKLNVKLVDHKTLIDMIFALDSPEKLSSLPKTQQTTSKIPPQQTTPEKISRRKILTQDRISRVLDFHQEERVISITFFTHELHLVFSKHLGIDLNLTDRITYCDPYEYEVEFSTQMSPNMMDRVHDGFDFFYVEDAFSNYFGEDVRKDATIVDTAERVELDIEDITVVLAENGQLQDALEKIKKERVDGDPKAVAVLAYSLLNYSFKIGTVTQLYQGHFDTENLRKIE